MGNLWMKRSRLSWIAMVLVFASVLLFSPAGLAREIVVTSTADSGTGTLRWALETARSGDVITFDPKVFPPGSPATIYPKSELPAIERPLGRLTIDGSNAGVIIDGRNVPGDWNNGLQIYSDRNTVMGLQIVDFAGSGIAICSASHNVIGGDRGIGDGPTGQGNLVSRNTIGIDVCNDAIDNVMTRNIIGTDSSGAKAWGNTRSGIWIEDGANRNTVGPDNIIAYNCHAIEISGPRAVSNTITANSIYSNECSPISLVDGGNGELDAPFLADVDSPEGRVTGWACPDCIVEVFTHTKDGQCYFEGETESAEDGWFVFQKAGPLVGRTVTATATNAQGSTSQLSWSVQLLQSGNTRKPIHLESRPSNELLDNRIGTNFSGLWHPETDPELFPEGVLDPSIILDLGLKRVVLAISHGDWSRVDWSKREFSVDPSHDAFITSLANSGVAITYFLSFWDKKYVAEGGKLGSPRFKSEGEIQRYLDFVQFIVRHFKDRIQYYQIWNEPTIRDSIQWIEVKDYITLVKRAVPIIRQEYPEAKIVVGATDYLLFPESRDYLFSILRSDIMPLVDVVSWHAMYTTSPEYDFHRQYYYDYPSIVQEIKNVASGHGFAGEYVADELLWPTVDQFDPTCEWERAHSWIVPSADIGMTMEWGNAFSETKSAKYYARGIVMHLGMDVKMSQILLWGKPQWYQTIQNLCTVMAGHEAITIHVEFDIDYAPIAHYGFQFPNGDRLFAIWTDGPTADDDPGVAATITFPGLVVEKVVGIDVLNGFDQELLFEVADESTIVHDLLVKDYPILLRLSGVTESENYQELLQKQVDRDGDGVPDEEDYCPDYPGDPATNGC